MGGKGQAQGAGRGGHGLPEAALCSVRGGTEPAGGAPCEPAPPSSSSALPWGLGLWGWRPCGRPPPKGFRERLRGLEPSSCRAPPIPLSCPSPHPTCTHAPLHRRPCPRGYGAAKAGAWPLEGGSGPCWPWAWTRASGRTPLATAVRPPPHNDQGTPSAPGSPARLQGEGITHPSVLEASTDRGEHPRSTPTRTECDCDQLAARSASLWAEGLALH